MPDPSTPEEESAAQDFERHAAERAPGIVREFFAFFLHSKKWWMLPILLTLLGIGVFLVASGTVAAPWLYTLF